MGNNEKESVYQYLRSKYAGVFTEKQIGRHIDDYIGCGIANQQVSQVLQKVEKGSRVLDIGCGFGSFVLEARERGLDAVGIDIANFELDFARKRLRERMPNDDPEYAYRFGSGFELPFESESFDIVTLWNVLEHVSDYKKLLAGAVSLLHPGGYLYIVCPDYASFRKEAHYGVFWPSLLPRKIARFYLKFRGKNPDFFDNNIFYRTNWEILWILKSLGTEAYDMRREKLENTALIRNEKTKKWLCF